MHQATYECLIKIFMETGKLSHDDAMKYLKLLTKEGRYNLDVWQ